MYKGYRFGYTYRAGGRILGNHVCLLETIFQAIPKDLNKDVYNQWSDIASVELYTYDYSERLLGLILSFSLAEGSHQLPMPAFETYIEANIHNKVQDLIKEEDYYKGQHSEEENDVDQDAGWY